MKKLIKFLTAILAGLVLSTAGLAEDKADALKDFLVVHCKYLADTQLNAEIGATEMAKSISAKSKHMSMESKEHTSQYGQKYWVSELTILVPRQSLQDKFKTGESVKPPVKHKYY